MFGTEWGYFSQRRFNTLTESFVSFSGSFLGGLFQTIGCNQATSKVVDEKLWLTFSAVFLEWRSYISSDANVILGYKKIEVGFIFRSQGLCE
jgi:hypothetical protein